MFYEGSRNVPSMRNGTYTLNRMRSWICPRTMVAQGAGETAGLRALSCQGDTSQEVGRPGREGENTQLGAARSPVPPDLTGALEHSMQHVPLGARKGPGVFPHLSVMGYRPYMGRSALRGLGQSASVLTGPLKRGPRISC